MTSDRRGDSASPKHAHAIHHREYVMGTVVTIDVYADVDYSEGAIYRQLEESRAVLQRTDAVFSTWNRKSAMSRVRHGEMTIEQAPAEVAEVLELCSHARELSRGWFDPWAMPGGIDPTGYVKGWAAQRALMALASNEISAAIVNAAGDIASFGGLADDKPFRFGIVDPMSPRQLACIVELTGALATSGTYERGGHLIDPHSGQPAARAASASVCGPDLGVADALATALAVSGEAGLEIVELLDGYEALVISFDGARRWTEHFPFASASALSPGPRTPPARRYRSDRFDVAHRAIVDTSTTMFAITC